MRPRTAPGRPLRHLMRDPRWIGLQLAARGLWVEMSVLADRRRALRDPSPVDAVTLAELADTIGVTHSDALDAFGTLERAGIARVISPDIIVLEAF